MIKYHLYHPYIVILVDDQMSDNCWAHDNQQITEESSFTSFKRGQPNKLEEIAEEENKSVSADEENKSVSADEENKSVSFHNEHQLFTVVKSRNQQKKGWKKKQALKHDRNSLGLLLIILIILVFLVISLAYLVLRGIQITDQVQDLNKVHNYSKKGTISQEVESNSVLNPLINSNSSIMVREQPQNEKGSEKQNLQDQDKAEVNRTQQQSEDINDKELRNENDFDKIKEQQQGNLNEGLPEENGDRQKLNQIKVSSPSQRNFTFSINGNQFTARLRTKKAVAEFNETLVQGLKYLRNTETDVITFREEDWQFDELLPLKISDPIQKNKEAQLILTNENKSFTFYKNLFLNPTQQSLLEIEYLLYAKSHGIDSKTQEKEMCVVGTGKNLFERNLFGRFLSSLNRQNYTNFKVFYVDDASNDNTTLKAFELVATKYPRLKSKITFLRNKQQVRAFSNKDSTMKEHCSNQSIIFDIDLDDGLIGTQVFNLFNALYSNQDLWVVHTKFVKDMGKNNIARGFSSKLKKPAAQYRRSGIDYHTSHLKTYRAALEHKIPIEYLMELHSVGQDKKLRYHRFASDSVMVYSLFQLAGDKRIKFLPYWVYIYYINPTESKDECHFAHQRYDEKRLRNLPTLQPLPNLGAEPQQTEKGKEKKIGEVLRKDLKRFKTKYESACFPKKLI